MGRPRSAERPALRRADCHRGHRKRRYALRGAQSAGEGEQHYGPPDHTRHTHRLSVFRRGVGSEPDGPILWGPESPIGAGSVDGDLRERFRPRGAQARFRVPGIPMTDAAAYSLVAGILLTPEVDLLEALFGDITTVSLVDALLAVGISAPIVVVARLVYRRVVLGILSEELARSTGINVALVNFVYLFLVTLVVAVGIKIVGAVLVGALVVVPAAAMKNVSRNLSSYALLSGLTGTASAGSGILLANYLGLPAGPLVVSVGTAIFPGALVADWIAS